jgi:glucokinase
MGEYSIGIDIGGTKIAGGLVDKEGQIVSQRSVATPYAGGMAVVEAVTDLIQHLKSDAQAGRDSVIGVGVGTAGQIDFAGGRVLSGTTNIRDWNDVPLRQLLEEATRLPVWVDNDGNVMTLAEAHAGAARGHADVVCLTLGTGVGGGVLSGGRLLRGAWGGAAELGHITVNFAGPPCNCGFRGCLEVYASGTGIAQRMRERLIHRRHQALPEVAERAAAGLDSITSHDVFAWMRAGDPLATETVQEMTQALAFGLVSLIHTFNPTVVVLGGGIMADGEWLRAAVERQVRQLGVRSLVHPVAIRLAHFGPVAGLVGAASQVWSYR